MIILICGLPGAGKTTLADKMVDWLKNNHTTVSHYNADAVRRDYDDWDFSPDGRQRQCDRMKSMSRNSKSEIVICDFVAPTEFIRNHFDADYIIFMDTINKSIFVDTNKVFQRPTKIDLHITDLKYNLNDIMENILCLNEQTKR